MPDLATGTHLGAWRIVRILGRGGMGEVYEAENTLSGTHRALKRIRPELLDSAESRERFLREVALSQRVRHPNIVECLDPFMVEDHIVLPMELLVGETLAARLGRGPMPEADAVALVRALARGAGALHREGLVHRDLKPGNVFLARGPDGRETPKILDLGATHEVLQRRLTQAGFAIGTMAYMAPEQAQGERVLDARVDVWALGVLLYICLTGKRPIDNDEQGSILEKHATNAPIAPPRTLRPDLAPELEAIVMRALSRRREQRFEDGDAMAAVLEERKSAPAQAAPAERPVPEEATVRGQPRTDAAPATASSLPVEDEPTTARPRRASRDFSVAEIPRAKIELDPRAARTSIPPDSRTPPPRPRLRRRGPLPPWATILLLVALAACSYWLGIARTAALAALALVSVVVWRLYERSSS